MDNQLVNTETATSKKRVAGIVLAVLLAIVLVGLGVRQLQVSNPYIKSVLSIEGDPVQGHAIFLMNCAGCHAWRTDSQVGPSLTGISQRKSEVGLIHQVISGKTPPMPQFQPSPQEMADLLSYLEQI